MQEFRYITAKRFRDLTLAVCRGEHVQELQDNKIWREIPEQDYQYLQNLSLLNQHYDII